MFGPWIEIYTFLRGLVPSKLRLPHFNFILLHYCYIIGCTIIGSIILYPAMNLSYIDALFFAAGASTQSGLNPVDVNLLYLYQQVTLMLIACIASPIFIHSSLVFIRLYWFEKRFQSVVLEAQKLRRTRERSRMKGEFDEEKTAGTEGEVGLGHRKIHVLRPGAHTLEKAGSPDDTDPQTSEETDSTDSKIANEKAAGPRGAPGNVNGKTDDTAVAIEDEDEHEQQEMQQEVKKQESPTFTRDIKFAEPQKPRERRQSELLRLPTQRTADDHIQFLEKQRKQEDADDDVLYIPGPRDFDRGDKPQTIQWAGDEELASPMRSPTKGSERFQGFGGSANLKGDDGEELNGDDHPQRESVLQDERSSSFPSAVYGRAKDKLRARKTRRGSDAHSDRSTTTPGQPMKHRLTSNDTFGRRGRTSTFASFLTTRTEDQEQDMPYLSYQPTMGRNSMFVNLSEEQREELGGIEYRSLKLLATFLVCYYVGFHLLGLLSFLPWIENSGTYKAVLAPSAVDPGWWGVFTPASMFNDLGFSLTPDSMTSFQYATWILLMGSFLIIIGNTGFPCMLRFIVWVTSLVVPSGSAIWEELRFLLDHPRRCFTLLFPSKATWWLFWVLVILNVVDLIFFIILDLNDPTVTSLPPGIRVLDGWFQAVSTRTAGFNVVSLSDLHPAIQVSYLIMMYISVLPIAISVRRTNVYEERSLGIYAGDQAAQDEAEPTSYVGAHLRRQLSFDLWFVFLGLFIIAIVEGGRIADNTGYDAAFSLFAILFEIVSAYGTVGLSLGYPNTNASFSAQLQVISKLVIIAMQIRGRHRGLPYALDKAVLLPSENLHDKEAEEALRRASRRSTAAAGPDEPALPTARTNTGLSAGGSDAARRRRSWGFGRLLGAGLSAGPTVSKRDE